LWILILSEELNEYIQINKEKKPKNSLEKKIKFARDNLIVKKKEIIDLRCTVLQSLENRLNFMCDGIELIEDIKNEENNENIIDIKQNHIYEIESILMSLELIKN